MHVPFTKPTLSFQPGFYFTDQGQDGFEGWKRRGRAGLRYIQRKTGLKERLLVENINYSPAFLESFWREGLCALCLDIGHLLLGNEDIGETLKQYLPVIREIHLHGVLGCDEHLSLNVMPEARVKSWLHRMIMDGYDGIVNLEVFNPDDLETSIHVLKVLEGSE